jgi:glyoxylase-like metal-dependent hydrolase (beta-lactamase superfamily II)
MKLQTFAAALRLIALAAVFLFAAPPVHASDLFTLEWSEVAPGVYVGARLDPLRYPVVANSVIVVGADSALVFDGGGFPSQGEQVLARLKAVTDKPLAYVVISHWHGDHNRGLGPLLAAFPNAAVIGTAFTRDAMLGAPLQSITRAEKDGAAKATADAVAAALNEGKTIDGDPITPAERAYFERFVADNAAHQAEIAGMTITPPSELFEGRRELDLGGRSVTLLHFGPGNTRGDAVLWVPDAGLVASGDVIVAPVPYGFGSYPKGWIKALDGIRALKPAIVVPGHGPVLRDYAYLDLLKETLGGVAMQMQTLVAAGKTKDEATAAVDFTAYEARFTGGDLVAARLFKLFFKAPLPQAAWNEANGIESEASD